MNYHIICSKCTTLADKHACTAVACGGLSQRCQWLSPGKAEQINWSAFF